MSVWQFVVVYLAIFALLQLAVYRYLREDEEASATGGNVLNADSRSFEDGVEWPSRSDRDPNERDVESVPAETGPTDGEEGTRRCPNCGAHNEANQVYSYCRNCASPLGH